MEKKPDHKDYIKHEFYRKIFNPLEANKDSSNLPGYKQKPDLKIPYELLQKELSGNPLIIPGITNREIKSRLKSVFQTLDRESSVDIFRSEFLRNEDEVLLNDLAIKINNFQNLNKNEIVFLYQRDHFINFTGEYKEKEFKIKFLSNLITKRKLYEKDKEDMQILFDCELSQIATKEEHLNYEINGKKIKVYIGPIFNGFFEKLPEGIEYVYTSFPDKRIFIDEIKVGDKLPAQIEYEFKEKNIQVEHNPNETEFQKSERLEKTNFVPNIKNKKIVRASLENLGLSFSIQRTSLFTIDQIQSQIEKFGLEFCDMEDLRYLALYLEKDKCPSTELYLPYKNEWGYYRKLSFRFENVVYFFKPQNHNETQVRYEIFYEKGSRKYKPNNTFFDSSNFAFKIKDK